MSSWKMNDEQIINAAIKYTIQRRETIFDVADKETENIVLNLYTLMRNEIIDAFKAGVEYGRNITETN